MVLLILLILQAILAVSYAEQTSQEIPEDIVLLSVFTKFDGGDSQTDDNNINSGYTDGSVFYLFGEIENNFRYPIKNVELNVTFYDSDGSALHSKITSPRITILGPGERSVFDLPLSESESIQISNYSYYLVSKSWNRAEAGDQKQELLQPSVDDFYLDMCDNYHIKGHIINLGPKAATGVQMTAAFYSDRFQIVSTATTFVGSQDHSLDPTKSQEYDIIIDRKSLPHFSHYSLVAISNEYASTDLKAYRGPIDEEHTDVEFSPFARLSFDQHPKLSVLTEKQSYSVSDKLVTIYGKLQFEHLSKEQIKTPVLIEIILPSGVELKRMTSALSPDGEFSRTIDFPEVSKFEGKVLAVRAKYDNLAAENTFLITNAGAEGGEDKGRSTTNLYTNNDYTSRCEDSKANIHPPVFSPLGANDVGAIDREKNILGTQSINITIENKLSEMQPFTVVSEILDSNGVVVFMDVQSEILAPEKYYDIKFSWTPEKAGMFNIKLFLLSSLTSNPKILSPMIEEPISISQS